MKKGLKLVRLLITSIIVLLATGCGKEIAGSGNKKAKIPEVGFSMSLPSRWTTENYAETEFYKKGNRKNSWGMTKFCPLWTFNRKFKSVSEFSKYLINEERFEGTLKEIISQKPLKIGEVQADAFEIIFKTINGNYVFTIFIEMENGEALQVFFQVSEKQYEEFRRQYPAVVKSIHLTKKRAVW